MIKLYHLDRSPFGWKVRLLTRNSTLAAKGGHAAPPGLGKETVHNHRDGA